MQGCSCLRIGGPPGAGDGAAEWAALEPACRASAVRDPARRMHACSATTQVDIAPHYYSRKEIMDQASKKLPKQLGKAADGG